MNILSFLAVAAASFSIGFLLGLCFGGKWGGASAPFSYPLKRAVINREFENFLTYDGSVQ